MSMSQGAPVALLLGVRPVRIRPPRSAGELSAARSLPQMHVITHWALVKRLANVMHHYVALHLWDHLGCNRRNSVRRPGMYSPMCIQLMMRRKAPCLRTDFVWHKEHLRTLLR